MYDEFLKLWLTIWLSEPSLPVHISAGKLCSQSRIVSQTLRNSSYMD